MVFFAYWTTTDCDSITRLSSSILKVFLPKLKLFHLQEFQTEFHLEQVDLFMKELTIKKIYYLPMISNLLKQLRIGLN
jgi:hypothetical protein